MTPEYILSKSLCRPAHCGDYTPETRLSEIENMQYASEYAEPGYTNPAKGILFANWNLFPRGVDSLLESYGYEIHWSDEWATCDDCGRAVRTSADCYAWSPSYICGDGGITCTDCLVGDAGSYLESLENNPRTALSIQAIDPGEYGYVLISGRYEAGFHAGMTDDPEKVYTELVVGGCRRVLFKIDERSQFYIRFSVWNHPEDWEHGIC